MSRSFLGDLRCSSEATMRVAAPGRRRVRVHRRREQRVCETDVLSFQGRISDSSARASARSSRTPRRLAARTMDTRGLAMEAARSRISVVSSGTAATLARSSDSIRSGTGRARPPSDQRTTGIAQPRGLRVGSRRTDPRSEAEWTVPGRRVDGGGVSKVLREPAGRP
jgi:hypothetical protein